MSNAKTPSHSFWYTPISVADSVRRVLGAIDLDPTSSEKANEVIGATKIFTIENSCLDKPWCGKSKQPVRVFMNPPYSKDCGTSIPFVNKLVEEISVGHVEHAIVLVNANTSSSWFQKLIFLSEAVCFPGSRIKFFEDVSFAKEHLPTHGYKDSEEGLREGTSPRYDNAIFLLQASKYWRGELDNPVLDRFVQEFEHYGQVMAPYKRELNV